MASESDPNYPNEATSNQHSQPADTLPFLGRHAAVPPPDTLPVLGIALICRTFSIAGASLRRSSRRITR
jgi:hypothetical protein